MKCTLFQALVGIAFSVGFIIGPVIGAMFAHWSHGQSGDWFVVPALFALCLALTDVAFVLVCFKETLPKVCQKWNLFLQPLHPINFTF